MAYIEVAKFDDTWAVVVDGETVASGLTNSRAWALADKLKNEPTSRQEDLADWLSRRNDPDEEEPDSSFLSKERKVTWGALRRREKILGYNGYNLPMWMGFCSEVMGAGLDVSMREDQRDASKYFKVTCEGESKSFMVRYSSGVTSNDREIDRECDLLVGKHMGRTISTFQAVDAVLDFFEIGGE